MKIAHIINVTEITAAKHASYLQIAQPVTLKSMVLAQQTAQGVVAVELFAIKHKSESVSIPPEFQWAADIEKYAWEYIDRLENVPPKPLPRITDIIEGLYQASDADYFIYTNLDIGLQPNFYLRINELLNQGFDALFINRKDLPKEQGGVLLDESQLELIFSIEGVNHPGIDCCVFKREIVPDLQFANVFIGFSPVGEVLKQQIQKKAKKFKWIKYERLTFHLGSDSPVRDKTHPYQIACKQEAAGLYDDSNTRSLWQRIKDKLAYEQWRWSTKLRHQMKRRS